MKKFSRMPKAEGSGGGGGAGGGAGGAGGAAALGRVFAVGRHQVTAEELLAEGNAGAVGRAGLGGHLRAQKAAVGPGAGPAAPQSCCRTVGMPLGLHRSPAGAAGGLHAVLFGSAFLIESFLGADRSVACSERALKRLRVVEMCFLFGGDRSSKS